MLIHSQDLKHCHADDYYSHTLFAEVWIYSNTTKKIF